MSNGSDGWGGGRGSRGLMVAVTVVAGWHSATAYGQPKLQVINIPHVGSLGDISTDGSTVVGHAMNPEFGKSQAFIWNADEGFQLIGSHLGDLWSDALGVSHDGSVVVGSHSTSSLQLPYRWTKHTGFEPLPLVAGATQGLAWDVSDDGSTVIGRSSDASKTFGFRWTAALGSQKLPGLTSFSNAHARAVTADGSIAVGTSQNMWTDNRACKWVGTGIAELPMLPGFEWSQAFVVSADGSTIAGHTLHSATGETAFRIGKSGISNIGTAGVYRLTQPFTISGDGRAIVGTGQLSGKFAIFIWSEELGVVPLKDWLASLIDLSEWGFLWINCMTPDGTILAGTGDHLLTGEKHVLHFSGLPPLGSLCYADLDASGSTDIDDFIHFQNLFAIGNLTADCDKSGTLTINDFVCFQTKFAGGCL